MPQPQFLQSVTSLYKGVRVLLNTEAQSKAPNLQFKVVPGFHLASAQREACNAVSLSRGWAGRYAGRLGSDYPNLR